MDDVADDMENYNELYKQQNEHRLNGEAHPRRVIPLPYNALPKLMLRKLAETSTHWLNVFLKAVSQIIIAPRDYGRRP
jgi:hypothetical protein